MFKARQVCGDNLLRDLLFLRLIRLILVDHPQLTSEFPGIV